MHHNTHAEEALAQIDTTRWGNFMTPAEAATVCREVGVPALKRLLQNETIKPLVTAIAVIGCEPSVAKPLGEKQAESHAYSFRPIDGNVFAVRVTRNRQERSPAFSAPQIDSALETLKLAGYLMHRAEEEMTRHGDPLLADLQRFKLCLDSQLNPKAKTSGRAR